MIPIFTNDRSQCDGRDESRLCTSGISTRKIQQGLRSRRGVLNGVSDPRNDPIRATFLAVVLAMLCFSGCTTAKKTGEVSALRSERDYAEGSEAAAQELYKKGQASSLAEARVQAAAAANQEWARAAKADERKQKQDKFEKDLATMDSQAK